jgi:hypothetical protein
MKISFCIVNLQINQKNISKINRIFLNNQLWRNLCFRYFEITKNIGENDNWRKIFTEYCKYKAILKKLIFLKILIFLFYILK